MNDNKDLSYDKTFVANGVIKQYYQIGINCGKHETNHEI